MGLLTRNVIAIFSLAAICGGITESLAQDSRGTTVTGRERPFWDAQGTRLGAFVLYPSLTLGSAYSDNIFATDEDEVDDVIFSITPRVAVQSDWAQHALGFEASANLLRYKDNQSEDVEDYLAAVNGRLDILRDTTLSSGLAFQRNHEERGSPDDVNGEEPTQYNLYGGQVIFAHRLNRLWTEVAGRGRFLDYEDVDAEGGGTINNDDRDRYEYGTDVTLGYDVLPDVGGFIRAGINFEDYQAAEDDEGFDRDSYSYGFSGGVRLDFTGLTFGELFGGVLFDEYEDSDFSSQTKFNVGVGLTWNVTPITTVNLNASRSFEETTVEGASTAFTTVAGASVDHELLRNVLLNAGFTYTIEEFEDANRTDDTIRGQGGVAYLINQYVHLFLNYTYTQRFSDEEEEDYSENLVQLQIRLQY